MFAPQQTCRRQLQQHPSVAVGHQKTEALCTNQPETP
jgi:hypothetical protein